MISISLFKGNCWICGSAGPMSGEHKIKRTDLEADPVLQESYWVPWTGRKRKIQSLNSKFLKFPNSICQQCNNRRTQSADRAYTDFRKTVDAKLLELAEEKELVLNLRAHTELERYFAKHLGCQMVYQKFPVPKRLAKLVLGKTNAPMVDVSVRLSPFIWKQQNNERMGDVSAIGGLALMLQHSGEGPSYYFTAFMNQRLQFKLKFDLSVLETRELRLLRLLNRLPTRLLRDEDEKKYLGL